jgi:hypothetical protein
MNAVVRDLGMLCKNSSCVFAARRVVRIGGVPTGIARRDAVVQDRVLKKFCDTLCVGTARQCFVGEMQLERCPAFGAVLARERLLDFTKTRVRPRVRPCLLQSSECGGFAGAQGFEPALGGFFQGIEAALRSEFADHGTFLPLAPCVRSLFKAGKRLKRGISDRLGRSELPCRGQVAPQCALRTVSEESGGLSMRYLSIGKKSPRRFFQTAASLPPAKGVTFAGCLVPALLQTQQRPT